MKTRTSTPRPRMRTRSGPAGASCRWGLAAAVAGVVVAVSYTGLRVASLARGEAALSEVVLAGSTAFYWRCGLTALHAAVAAALVGFGVPEARAEVALRYAPIWVPGVVLPLVLVLVGFP